MSKLRSLMAPEELERARSARRLAYARKRDQEIAYAAAYREKNRELLREKSRAASAGRKDYLQGYYAANKAKIAARASEWKSANRDRVSAKNSEWRRSNPDKHRSAQHARRSRVAGTGGTLSKDIVARLLRLQSGLCTCCGQLLGSDYHIDHIVPISRGGTNTDENVQLLLAKCNLRKGTMTHTEYMARKGAA